MGADWGGKPILRSNGACHWTGWLEESGGWFLEPADSPEDPTVSRQRLQWGDEEFCWLCIGDTWSLYKEGKIICRSQQPTCSSKLEFRTPAPMRPWNTDQPDLVNDVEAFLLYKFDCAKKIQNFLHFWSRMLWTLDLTVRRTLRNWQRLWNPMIPGRYSLLRIAKHWDWWDRRWWF